MEQDRGEQEQESAMALVATNANEPAIYRLPGPYNSLIPFTP
jgi:hypothetical protein